MMRRTVLTAVICVAALASAEAVSAQRTSQSDATGAVASLFSRGFTRAFAAPPAPPPTLIVTPPILEALCVERADALLTYATLSTEASNTAERTVLTLMRGGAGATEAGQRLTSVFVGAGAGANQVDALISASNGLFRADRPEVPDVSAAVSAYNTLVQSAPPTFLASPPAEFVALRRALGRLTAAANVAVSAERVYPDLPTAEIRYANDAPWLVSGQPIQVMGATFAQYGTKTAVGERRFKRVGEYNGVWVLAEEPVSGVPRTIYVPLRTYCDIELQPYAVQEKVIKGLGLRNR